MPRPRKSRTAALGAVAAVVVLAAGLSATLPSSAAPRSNARPRLVISGLSQQGLLGAGTVSVRAVGGAGAFRPRSGHFPILRVLQFETTGGTTGTQTPITRSLRVHKPGTLAASLTSGGRSVLARCAPRRIVAELDLGGRTLARAARDLALDAPRCANFFSPTSFWNTPLASDAPLDPASDAISATLRNEIASEMAKHFGPSINTTQYSVPIYTVPLTQPTRPVVLDRAEPFAVGLKAVFAGGVPVPDNARPAAGNDQHLVIWQPDADKMWEFFRMHQVGGVWHATWGGYMANVSSDPGYFPKLTGAPWGATATSLPLAGGLIRLAELRQGVIGHVLAFAMPSNRAKWWSLPAQRTDGNNTAPDSVPEGALFRLPAGLDIPALKLPPLVQMIAIAAQKYGMVLRDTAATTLFYGEDPTPSGSSAWGDAFAGAQPGSLIAHFPWDRLVLTKMTLQTYNHGPAIQPVP